MKSHKSEKIEEVVHQYDRKLNLHEIKAKTGAGSGYKYGAEAADSNPIINKSKTTTKSEKIQEAVSNVEGKVNLHKIKAQTGAGNGFITEKDLKDKVNTPPCDCSNPQCHCGNTHKSHKIHAVFHSSDKRLNLHEIKEKTGAGSGYKN